MADIALAYWPMADRIAQEPGVTLLRAPLARRDDPASVLRQIAQDAAERLRREGFGAVIATGGDTMGAVLDRLESRRLWGDDHALRRAIAQLRQTPRSQKRYCHE